MAKKLIRLTESDIHRIVKESVKRILRESPNESIGAFLPKDLNKAKDADEYDKMSKFNQHLQRIQADNAQKDLDKFTHDDHTRRRFGPGDPGVTANPLSIESRIINKVVTESVNSLLNEFIFWKTDPSKAKNEKEYDQITKMRKDWQKDNADKAQKNQPFTHDTRKAAKKWTEKKKGQFTPPKEMRRKTKNGDFNNDEED